MNCRKCSREPIYTQLPEEHMNYGRWDCPEHGLIGWEPYPKNKNKRRDKNQHHRAVWWDNVGFICAICGITHKELPESSQWDCDHIIPLSKDGIDKTGNTMMLCKDCHAIKNALQRKGDKLRNAKPSKTK